MSRRPEWTGGRTARAGLIGLVALLLILVARLTADAVPLALLACACVVPVVRPLPLRAALLDPGWIFSAAAFLYFGVRSAVITWGLDSYLLNPIVRASSAADVRVAGDVVALSLLAAGLTYAALAPAASVVPATGRRRLPSASLVPLVLMLLGLPGLVMLALNAAPEGGVALSPGIGSLVQLSVGCALAALAAATLGVMRSRDSRVAHWMAFGGSALLILATAGLTLSKDLLVLAAIAMLIPVVLLGSARVLRMTLAVAVVVALLLVPVVTAGRAARAEGAGTGEALVQIPARLATVDLVTMQPLDLPATLDVAAFATRSLRLSSRRLAGFDSVLTIVPRTPSELPYEKGRTYLPLLTAPIPRVIWPGKPVAGTGTWFTENYWAPQGGNRSAQPATLPGEAYINFGFVGAVGVGALFGALLALLGRVVLLIRTEVAQVVLLAGVLALAASVERTLAFSTLGVAQRLAVPLIVLGLWTLVATRSSATP